MHAMINWYRASFRHPHRVTGDGLVRVPTRIVWGMKDPFFETRLAQLSVNHCADASLVEIAAAGHWLLHEEPERTSNQMIEFFGEPAQLHGPVSGDWPRSILSQLAPRAERLSKSAGLSEPLGAKRSLSPVVSPAPS